MGVDISLVCPLQILDCLKSNVKTNTSTLTYPIIDTGKVPIMGGMP